MKKLLVFAMVLGIAGLATADLSFKINGFDVSDGGQFSVVPGPVTVEIVNTESFAGSYDIGWICVTEAATSDYTSGHAYMPPLLGDWWIDLYGEYEGDVYWAVMHEHEPANAETGAGTMLKINFTASDAFSIAIWDTEYSDIMASSEGQDPSMYRMASCMIVPEPMTIVLLGLGGLLMRRKK